MKKSDRDIMEILEAYDTTGTAHSAAQLAGVDPKTVRRYVAARDAGMPVTGPSRRPRIIDEHLPQIEQWVERSKGKVRADIVHERLVALGFDGTERTTRRAVAEAKAAWRAGHRRTYRPWITEPGLWMQFDWGAGPKVPGPGGILRSTLLFCAWLAWSRYRVVIPVWDQTLPTLIACLDATVRRFGGVPTYALTDNPRTVSIDHVAGIPVRHPQIVETARHYGMAVHTCVPFDPESKGGSEATVKIAKADLVPTDANLLPDYASFADLEAACEQFCATVNARRHRESARIPEEALAEERARLHTLPTAPHTLALGTTRSVGTDQTIRFGSVRYSTPPGLVGTEVWVRAAGTDLVVVADLDSLPRTPDWAGDRRGLTEIARHRLSTPGNPSIDLAHYPGHPQEPDGAPRPPRPKARSAAEARFLDLGPGAHTWLVAASAAGTVRIRAKMTAAVELAVFVGAETVDSALSRAAEAGRFAEGDLPAIVAHHTDTTAGAVVVADEEHSVQPGTAAWAGFGSTSAQASS
ncbi:IS21 family transposase [Rhodococcus koreensis]|uniref:Transposase n=1 Tax=Rhodococcus koreensis TaxID=99653 RepID=A0A1H4WDR7_9NOCA|nr:IS21 family transposase [Rhodococcus koreensis]SEB31750.1 Transposase [Rhodococcus koreensis]SEC91463.1 Transposase [Rhodococcus koreensis]